MAPPQEQPCHPARVQGTKLNLSYKPHQARMALAMAQGVDVLA